MMLTFKRLLQRTCLKHFKNKFILKENINILKIK